MLELMEKCVKYFTEGKKTASTINQTLKSYHRYSALPGGTQAIEDSDWFKVGPGDVISHRLHGDWHHWYLAFWANQLCSRFSLKEVDLSVWLVFNQMEMINGMTHLMRRVLNCFSLCE